MRKDEMYFARTISLAISLFFLFNTLVFSQNSIFTNQIPASVGNDSDYELGTKFTTSEVAEITKIKFYKTPGESGLHTGKIWSINGEKLMEVGFNNETASGWQFAELSSPLIIHPGETYIVSVNANTEYPITQNELLNQITSGFLSTVADNNNGVFNEVPELFPSQSFNNSNYYRDIEAVSINTIFTTQTPVGEFNDGPYEMGVKFTTSQAAKVIALSYYKMNGESGLHTGNLWSSSGNLIASVNFVNETSSGWQYAFLTNPVNISPDTEFAVSVNSNTAYGASAQNALANPIANGILSTVADNNNGVYSGSPNTQGVFPTNSYNNTNYFRDVIVEPINLPGLPNIISPSVNQTDVSIEPTLTWSLVEGADSYTLELAADENFTNLVFSQSGLTSNTYSFDGLLNNHTYYWRISAENFAGTSGYTSGSFKTVKAHPIYLAYPVSGEITYSDPLTLTWYTMSSNSGFKFDLIYSQDPGMNSPVVIPNINSLSTSLGGLQPGTIYYWRIRSKTTSGAVASYSDIESFKTNGEAVIPIPSYPVNNDIVYTYSPTLYWYINAFDAGLTYDLELREGGAANLTGIPTAADLTELNYVTSGLSSDKEYSWQVRSKLGNTYSDWSQQVTFKTVKGSESPVKPTPSWPVDNAVVYSTETSLFWFVQTNGVGLSYELEIVEGNSSSLTGTANVVNISSLHYKIIGLEEGKTYTWSVRSTDGVDFSDWSDPASFEVYESNTIPTLPILSYPVNNAVVYTNKVLLSWYLLSSYTGITFDIEYGTGPLTGTPTQTGLTEGNFEISNLSSGATYSWSVRASNGNIVTDWTAPETFTTTSIENNVASIPILSWPIGGATIYSTSQTLFWYLNAQEIGLSYELEYSKNSNMSSPITVSNISNKYLTVNGLEHGTTYYWRVRSYNGLVYSNYSDVESFVTSADNGWAVPIVGSPSGGVEINSSSPKLSWFSPTNSSEVSYVIEYSQNSDMSNFKTIETSEKSYVMKNLESSSPYYWRVRSKNAEGESSEFSEISKFIIANGVTDISDKNELPREFALMQNYPNPFNPTSTFEFSIADQGFYTFNIFNVLGEKISTLLSKNLNPGNYKINFDAINLSSGMYIYTLSGNNLFLSRKMILLK